MSLFSRCAGHRSARVPWGYLAISAVATLASARLFYGYMLQQTGGEWSAPLDDVFIHFDYARAAARGYPFQWSEGNGYSSGNTSVLYPFALALGYLVGFRGASLMVWAAMVACVSVLGLLWAAHGLFARLPRWSTPLAPAALFSVGALAWSLWSGMEVAFFLGLWGAALALALGFERRAGRGAGASWALGGAGALLVLTRPEAAVCVLALGVFAAAPVLRARGFGPAAAVALRAGAPAVIALATQAIVNAVMTGETAANGAIVKLALYNPYMTAAEKIADWRFNLDYAFDRLTQHHFGEIAPWGVERMHATSPPFGEVRAMPWGRVPLLLGAVALLDRRTRDRAMLLWCTALLWVLVVALNGQVRWQNERYLMPAVAWVLLAAALGVGVLVDPPREALRGLPRPVVRTLGVAVVTLLLARFWRGERVQYRDQVWFFARASRNIRDQHTTAGRLLRTLSPPPKRVLVGDAGALMYASDLPGFDLIGLGGYHELPLARAGVHGVAATLELIERLAPEERPDVMAIYATWWPSLPGWFGSEITRVPVRGNVICGGAEKVLLRADWRLLGTGSSSRSLGADERVVDELDVADLVSEREHGYAMPRPQAGWTEMRVLPDPGRPTSELWDAGRRIPIDRTESFTLRAPPQGRAGRLLLRTVVDRASAIDVTIDGATTRVALGPSGGWREASIEVPAASRGERIRVEITPREGEWVGYHAWLVVR